MLNDKELSARSLGTSRDLAANSTRFRRLPTRNYIVRQELLDFPREDLAKLASAMEALGRADGVHGKAAKLMLERVKQLVRRMGEVSP